MSWTILQIFVKSPVGEHRSNSIMWCRQAAWSSIRRWSMILFAAWTSKWCYRRDDVNFIRGTEQCQSWTSECLHGYQGSSYRSWQQGSHCLLRQCLNWLFANIDYSTIDAACVNLSRQKIGRLDVNWFYRRFYYTLHKSLWHFDNVSTIVERKPYVCLRQK